MHFIKLQNQKPLANYTYIYIYNKVLDTSYELKHIITFPVTSNVGDDIFICTEWDLCQLYS